MIITSTSGKYWILPKGRPEEDLNKAQVAELETYEEAGVKGIIPDLKLRKDFKRDEGGKFIVYPLLIETILNKWPEQNKRERRLVSIKDALHLVKKKEHLNAIKHFSATEMLNKLKKG